MKTGSRIKLMRLLLGLTQEELAGLAGISRPSLVNYEQGEYSPIDDISVRLAGIFGVEPGYLRYGTPVVQNQVWIPSIPKHAQRRQNLIDELGNLLPDFIAENSFSGVIVGTLANGTSAFLFGRGGHYDCLLVASSDLFNVVQNSFLDINDFSVEKINLSIVNSFGAHCLVAMHGEISRLDLEFDTKKMLQSLTRISTIKTRSVTNLDAVSLEYAAKNDRKVRDRLVKVADTICHEMFGDISLDQLLAGQLQNVFTPSFEVSAYSDPVSKAFCVILKAAYDVLAAEQKN